MSMVYIGLGSNLHNPLAQITEAFAELDHIPKTRLVARSANYSSQAMGGPDNQPDYINAVALLDSKLSPFSLLDFLQAIELAHGRERLVHWGPRTLDLDILLVEKQIIETDRLKVPHPQLNQRNFVLYPLAEISPNLVLPSGIALQSLLSQCPLDGLRQLPF